MFKKVALLFVIIIVVTSLVLLTNPIERLREMRDNQRVADLNNLKTAIENYISNNAREIANNKNSFCDICKANTVYSYREVSLNSDRNTTERKGLYVNSTGWLPLDLSKNAKIGTTHLKLLPLDPSEQAVLIRQKLPLLDIFGKVDSNLVYTFTAKGDKYKLTAEMESKKGLEKAKNDSGTDDDRLEIGSDLTLKP